MGKTPDCADLFLKTQGKGPTTSVQKPKEVPQLEAAYRVPWDDDEGEDDFINQDFEEHANNDLLEGTTKTPLSKTSAGTYSESAHESALRFGIRYNTAQFYETKLLKLLNDANAPHFLYKEIVEWARAAHGNKYQFDPKRSSRNAQVKYLEKWLEMQKSRPLQIPTSLPGPVAQTVHTTCFNFTNQLHSLVSDHALFGKLENLDLNNNDPFAKYTAPNNLLSTINSGRWYHDAYEKECKNPSTDFLMPIIMACDETHLQKGSKASSWPLLFTTSILNQKIRNLPIAWRTLGYINDLSLIQSAAEDKNNSTEKKAERLHAIFKTILASLIEAQKPGALDNIPIRFGNVTKVVDLKVPVLFIIGDMQGGDKICTTACHYSNKMNRLCRKCNVRGRDSGNPLVRCKRISMEKMSQFVNDDDQVTLDRYNQYNVHNAWFDVSYGGCKYGIFSAACPIEPLHSLENGIISVCLLLLFNDEMKGTQKGELDAIVRGLTRLPRQRFSRAGTQPDMPRLLWKDGITSLTDLSAKYRVGIMFTIVVVSLQDEGIIFFTDVFKSAQRLNDMRQVFQMLLTYWVWLKRDTYWKRFNRDAKEGARQAIQVMLVELMRLWPRTRGQGWELAKIHEQLHVPDDIERNGAPQGSNTGPTEHNHIRLVKRPAKGTQQRAEVFDQQLGQRVSDSYIVDMAYQRMTTTFDCSLPSFPESEVIQTELSSQGTNEWVSIEVRTNQPATFHFDPRSGREDNFCPAMIEFLQAYYREYQPPGSGPEFPGGPSVFPGVHLGTEYKRTGTIFRGHADYRHEGPWYDWVMLRWEREDNKPYAQPPDCQAGYGDDKSTAQDYLYAPGQILGFVKSPSHDGVQVVVSTCEFSHTQGSVFSTKWKQSYVHYTGNRRSCRIEIVDVDSIVRHCLMVPHDANKSSYHEIWCQELWGDQFYQIIDEP